MEDRDEKHEAHDGAVEEKAHAPQALTVKINVRALSILAIVLVVAGGLFYFRGIFVAALVNGQPISRLSVIRELEKQSGKQALDSLITKKLVEDEAGKKGITVSPNEVQDEIKKIEDQVSKQGTTLQAVLTQQGMTKDRLMEQIGLQKKIEKLLADKLAVSDAEADKYIQDNKITPTKDQKPEDLKNQVREQLKQQKFSQEADVWISTLKAGAKIDYLVSF